MNIKYHISIRYGYRSRIDKHQYILYFDFSVDFGACERRHICKLIWQDKPHKKQENLQLELMLESIT